MAISKKILGMNARNFLYIRPYNKPSAKRRADDKLETKRFLIDNNIPTPPLISVFYDRLDVHNFNWNNLPESGFAVKPTRGYGGSGILVFKNWRNGRGMTVDGEIYDIKKLESHLFDILDGAFSLQYLPDNAFIEELITPHPFFKKIAPMGLTDLRIIIFRKVPVMAMLRVPTSQSSGKANLHLGAIAVGIDISTGITTTATHNSQIINVIPATRKKTAGIKLPDWDKILILASTAQSVIGLGFAGVDIVLDAKKGPMVLEINSRPGLKIQNANLASLRTRLERVEDMNIQTPKRGVELAKNLFAEAFSEKVTLIPEVLPVSHPVIISHNGEIKEVMAKLDTGAYRSSIDKRLARELGLTINEEKVFVKSASGKAYRPTTKLTFNLAGKKIVSTVSVADRSHLVFPMIIGRIDLQGFLIKPELDQEEGDLAIEEDI